MARAKKEVVAPEVEQKAVETPAEVEEVVEETANEVKKTEEAVKIPAEVEKLMKLYPQYEKLYVTANGFVHPENAPKYVLKDATLYTNKYYNNNK